MLQKALLCGILVSLSALLPLPAAGQSAAPSTLRFGHLGVEQGISHTTVWDVLQDRAGFLWIGTESSLQRYDGYELVDFRHDPKDPHSLSDSEVMVIYEDPAGILYFATRARGINRYDSAEGRFERFRLDGEISRENSDTLSPLVSALTADPQGQLFVGTLDAGLLVLDPRTRRLRSFRHSDEPGSLGSDEIDALYTDRQGRVFVGHGAGVDRFLPEQQRFEHYSLAEASLPATPDAVMGIGEVNGELWVASGSGSLYFLRGDRFVRQASWPIPIGIARSGPDGSFWFGTYGTGLYHYDPRQGSLVAARCQPEDAESLSSDNLLAMRFDRAGILWIGGRNGLSIYDPRRSQFEVARPGRGLPAATVGSILIDRSGEAWLGSVEGELIAWHSDQQHPEQQTFRTLAKGLGAVDGLIETRSGEIWVGAGSGLYRLDRQHDRLVQVTGPGAPGAVSVLFEDRFGYLWIGHAGGASRLNREGRFEPFAGEGGSGWPRNSVYAIYGDRQGKMWVGGDGGLFEIDLDSGAVRSWQHHSGDPTSLPYEQVSDLLEDRQGRLWVGTYGGGLALFDRDSGRFTRFGSQDGLADDRVCSLIEDARGELWVATNHGLSHLDPAAWQAQNYDSADGLASDVFLLLSRAKFADGRVVFGGHQGLTAFYPERLRSDRLAPPVLITELRVGGEVMRPGEKGSPLSQAIASTRRFQLDFRQRSFALQFAAPHFANPKKNRFAYRLLGYEESFTETGAGDRRARYTNLDPGTYTFEVKACNEDGVWNEAGAQVEITVLPPPWRTPAAYALYAALLMGGVWGYNRWQERRLAAERRVADELARLNAELERLVEKRTSEVNQLTGLLPICSGCKKIRDQDGNWQSLEAYLNSVGDVKLSHGICRDCAKRLYPDIDIDQLAG